MNELGEIIELQGTGEGRSFTLSEQQELVRLCAKGHPGADGKAAGDFAAVKETAL